jgi:hypothetical protein
VTACYGRPVRLLVPVLVVVRYLVGCRLSRLGAHGHLLRWFSKQKWQTFGTRSASGR